MGDVGDVAEYALRRDKVAASASMVEGKVRAQLRVVEGLSRVVKMIEIEVDLEATGREEGEAFETAYDAASLSEAIRSVREMEEEWALQVEAKSEIERMLSAEETTFG